MSTGNLQHEDDADAVTTDSPHHGELCNCGRPAAWVYVTKKFGRVPFCGIPNRPPISQGPEVEFIGDTQPVHGYGPPVPVVLAIDVHHDTLDEGHYVACPLCLQTRGGSYYLEWRTHETGPIGGAPVEPWDEVYCPKCGALYPLELNATYVPAPEAAEGDRR